MSIAEEQLERIVRLVMEQLRGTGAAPSKQEATGVKQLKLDVAVVSTSQLEGRLNGIEQLIVRRGSVITPAVRDLLKEKNVVLTWSTDGTRPSTTTQAQPNTTQTTTTLAVGLAEANFSPAELLRKLAEQAIAIERIAQTGLTTSVDEIATNIARGGQLGLLLTDNVTAALCLANRHRGVRAVAPLNRVDAAAAVKSLGANMLIVSPRGRSVIELQQMTLAMVRSGTHACPEAYRGRLD